ncbi:MAG: TlpA family protein disulfide reductase [Acidobacteria bacterium]|nr:TlpA family protein disulfide reductase [Acidobacteriota bacterium]
MAALAEGTNAPRFSLPLLGGGSFSLESALQRGPALLAFFKISCPVCQFTLPYVERIFRSYGHENVTIAGVSQDDAAGTAQFAKQYGLTLPLALDDVTAYPVSNQYGLTNVPTLFFLAPSGTVEVSCVGWSRADMERISREIAFLTGATQAPVIHRGESVPDFKGG